MRATDKRTSVSQTHLARSAAIISGLGKIRRNAKKVEQLDGVQRYAFVTMHGQLFALKAKLGSRVGIVCGGISNPLRVPRTTAEKLAVLRAEAILPDTAHTRPAGIVSLMANKIIEVAVCGRAVTREDFGQCGATRTDIDTNFDAAMKLARKLESRLDQMVTA